jgi:hypothetical protein
VLWSEIAGAAVGRCLRRTTVVPIAAAGLGPMILQRLLSVIAELLSTRVVTDSAGPTSASTRVANPVASLTGREG